jgi:hypothetical protein
MQYANSKAIADGTPTALTEILPAEEAKSYQKASIP